MPYYFMDCEFIFKMGFENHTLSSLCMALSTSIKNLAVIPNALYYLTIFLSGWYNNVAKGLS